MAALNVKSSVRKPKTLASERARLAQKAPAMDNDLDAKLFAATLHAITHIWGREMSDLQRASLAGEIVREIDRRKIVNGPEPRALVHRLGAVAVYVTDRLKDDGDGCVALGSTNDAELLRKAKEEYDAYRFETGDMGSEDTLAQIAS